MAPIMKFLSLALLCSLIIGGNCQCSCNSLRIIQSRTEELFHSKQVWSVKITNNCACAQLDVKLSCNGFQTVKDIDLKVLANTGGACLVKDGQPIHSQEEFSFTYAFDTQFPFMLLSSQITC